MAFKISADPTAENHYLAVESDGVKYVQAAPGAATHHFRFSDIECVLLSEDHLLSIQAAGRVYSIPTHPDNDKHQTAISALVQAVQSASGRWAASED
jgi:hypothetical protein